MTLGWQQLHRLRFIEAVLLWEGRLTSGRLMEVFSISRAKASLDFRTYRECEPTNIYYDTIEKGYFATNTFKPRWHNGQFSEYLLLSGRETHERVCLISTHHRNLNRQAIRPVLHALWENKGIYIRYSSLTSGIDQQSRLIWPKRIIDTGFRWHVRALTRKVADNETTLVYRDYTLSRIIDTEGFVGQSEPVPDQDWETQLTLMIAPNPQLNNTERQIIAHEYAMTDECMQVNTNAALVNYELDLLQISRTEPNPHPAKQHLVLTNHGTIAPYLY